MTITSYMTNRVSTETLKYSSNDYYVCNIQISICNIQFLQKLLFWYTKNIKFSISNGYWILQIDNWILQHILIVDNLFKVSRGIRFVA